MPDVLRSIYPYLKSLVGDERAEATKDAYRLYSTYGVGAAIRGEPTMEEAQEAYLRGSASGKYKGDLPEAPLTPLPQDDPNVRYGSDLGIGWYSDPETGEPMPIEDREEAALGAS